MPSCLGLYIENNVIKYAKVSKDNDNIKVDSFGIKFYDKIGEAIKQVVEETYSYKTPISINLSNEEYHYFYLFSLLNKKDMQNVVNTEFESLCYDRGVNKDAFETRYVLVEDEDNKEKIKAIHVSANKADIAKKEQELDGYHIASESPIGTSIGNLLEYKAKENVLIVNIEDKTTITTILDKKIVEIQTIDNGSTQILSNINAKENSYSKAYEICKNSTIYTQEGKDLQYEENEYLDDIMPTLYNIVTEVRKIVDQSLNKIDKIYITGTASVINNIDIYFQEYLKDIKCEILKPYFISNSQTKINIKDYIEVNSAIALALDGIGEGLRGLNFKKETFRDKLPEWLTADVGNKKEKNAKGKKNQGKNSKLNLNVKFNLKMDFKEKLSKVEISLIRVAVAILLLIVIYSGMSIFLNNAYTTKEEEVASAIQEVNTQISTINSQRTSINALTTKYKNMTEKLEELASKTQEKNKRKNAIPTLLNQIMFIIPKGVQITSIENTSGDTIVINAQSSTYEQLGYLKSKIKEDEILLNVVSDSGTKEGQTGLIKTVIEGELPIK
jgi:Tfp pilus assembly protein PilN